jgi:hypothetical protein
MAASKTDLTIKRGTTYPILFENTDDADVAIDLTGATVYFTAKVAESDNDTSDAGATIKKDVTVHVDDAGVASATRGISTIALLPADTNKTPGTYHYDITVKYANGAVNTPIEGKLKIDGKPTNRST